MTLCLCLQSSWSEKKQIYIAGTFPIGGSEGWQGGQVMQTNRQRPLSQINNIISIRLVYPRPN